MLSRYAQPSEQQQQEGYLGHSNFHDNNNAYPAQEESYPRRPTPYADHDSIVKPEIYHHSQPSNNNAHSHHPTPSAPIAVDTRVYRQFSEFGSSHTSSTVSPEQTSAWLPETSSNPYNSFDSHTSGMSYTAIPGHNQQMYRQPLAYHSSAPFNFATSSSNDNIYQTAIYGFSGSSSYTDTTAFKPMSVHGQLGMDDGFNRNAAQLNQGYHSSKNLYASDSGVISTDVLSHANSSQHSDHAPHALYDPCSPVHSLSATATPPPPALPNDYQDGASIGRSSSLRASSSSSYTAEPQRGKRNSNWPTDRVPYKLRRSSDPTSTAAETKAQQPDSKNRRKATWSTSSLDPTFGPNVSIEKKMQELEQLEHYDLQLKAGSSGIDKKEKRRLQNRLAQRAFRARSKVHGKETVSHVASLEHLAETQLDRLTKMTAVVDQLRKENTSLQLGQSADGGLLHPPQSAGSMRDDQHVKMERNR